MAAAPLVVREIDVLDVSICVVTLADRRPQGSSSPIKWTFQSRLEALLYGNRYGRSTGAVYALLKRTTADGPCALPLKKSSISDGLVTEAEFEQLRSALHTSVRSFTLVPLTLVEAAIAVYGQNEKSEALVKALGLARPADWEEEGEEAEEDEIGEGDDDQEDEDEGSNDDESSSSGAGGSGSAADPRERPKDSPPSTEEETDAPDAEAGAGAKRARAPTTTYALTNVSEQLEAELACLDAHRSAPINAARAGTAVASATRASDRACILRLLGWLHAQGKLETPTLAVFAHQHLPIAVKRFVDTLLADGCKYKTIANHLGSFIAAARFVTTRRQKGFEVIAQLTAMHRQAKQQARRQGKIELGKKKAEWLEWPDVLKARVAAEQVFAAYNGGDLPKKIRLMRDVLIMRLHSDQPPDRVGVIRTLQLGGTLQADDDGYRLVISEEEAHKTVAVFGATNTSLNTSTATWISRYITTAASSFTLKTMPPAPFSLPSGLPSCKPCTASTAAALSAPRT